MRLTVSHGLGGTDLEFREYIVYEGRQVYPEYKVFYHRK